MHSVVMIGATGAVGGEVVKALNAMPLQRLTLLGRRPVAGMSGAAIVQQTVDVLDPASYAQHLPGHATAICTLGVGQPSAASKDELVRVDKTAVLDFAAACRETGVQHFELLGSVGASAGSPSVYLRTKGELEDGLRALGFRRLSLFRPSMILTPTNRYGLSQALVLALCPRLTPLLLGPLRRYRGIRLGQLGRAIANNIRHDTRLVWKLRGLPRARENRMSGVYPRDLKGYGRTPPHPHRPNDARVAVSFVINYEEGAENSILHGDTAAEHVMSEMVDAIPLPTDGRRERRRREAGHHGPARCCELRHALPS